MEYHEITEVYKNSVACFRLGSSLVNIDTVSPTFADMFSLLLVQSGEAVFSINSREYTVVRGDLLLLSPSILVAITGQSADFVAMNLMCDRSFFEHLLSLNIAYQSYSLFFCRTDFPVIHLSEEQAETIAASMRQISETISYVCVYRKISFIISCMSCCCKCWNWWKDEYGNCRLRLIIMRNFFIALFNC